MKTRLPVLLGLLVNMVLPITRPRRVRGRARWSVRPGVLLLRGVSRIAPGLKPRAQKSLIKTGYQLLSLWDRRAGLLVFMNYGYASHDSDPGPPVLRLQPADERDRLAIQLYHRVASAVDLRDKDVLEIGCGRGGGASYVKRYLGPRTVTGVDFAGQAVDFCRRRHPVAGLSFMRGDAEALLFPANSFDAVLNVESSHCYPDVPRFFSEVRRVLRPGGFFLFADLRPVEQVDKLRRQLIESGLTLREEERVTPNVARALELDSDRRVAFHKAKVPRWLRSALNEFAAVKGTAVYDHLSAGRLEYLRFVLQKPEDVAGTQP